MGPKDLASAVRANLARTARAALASVDLLGVRADARLAEATGLIHRFSSHRESFQRERAALLGEAAHLKEALADLESPIGDDEIDWVVLSSRLSDVATRTQTVVELHARCEQSVQVMEVARIEERSQAHTTTLADVLMSFLADWRMPIRAAGFTAMLGGIALALVVVGIKTNEYLNPTTTISVKENGTLVFQRARDQQVAQVLVSANGGERGPWVPTGVWTCKGQEVEVWASGKVNLALHHMVEAAFRDVPPFQGWVGPDGRGDRTGTGFPDSPRQRDNVGSQYLLAPGQPYGQLVGVFSESTPEAIPVGVFPIGAHGRLPGRDGRLWLAVNEIWLKSEGRDAYVGEEQLEASAPSPAFPAGLSLQPSSPTSERWKDLKKQQYWGLWFDDNAGAFLTTIKIEERGRTCPDAVDSSEP